MPARKILLQRMPSEPFWKTQSLLQQYKEEEKEYVTPGSSPQTLLEWRVGRGHVWNIGWSLLGIAFSKKLSEQQVIAVDLWFLSFAIPMSCPVLKDIRLHRFYFNDVWFHTKVWQHKYHAWMMPCFDKSFFSNIHLFLIIPLKVMKK